MIEHSLLIDALRLLGAGMGIVFSFLLLLVALLRLMSWVAHRIAPPGPELSLPPTPLAAGDVALVAVISAAIARYRAAHRPTRGRPPPARPASRP
ncbi:MAG: sodium pump decarboxylase subunit gamma [Chromatiaceae bacterium]|nr:MAG: sodium pump decarboxylase subunit gamma [Chromatiaceae bacterium]